MNTPSEQVWEGIRRDFNRGSIDYGPAYLMLFASFNQWFSVQARTTITADALDSIQDDVRLWRLLLTDDDSHMVSCMRKLYIMTKFSPLPLHFRGRWSGRLEDVHDWRGLIWLWYAVRCLLSHGPAARPYSHLDTVVMYAHTTLTLYMSRVLQRHACDYENGAMLPLYETNQTVYNNPHKS